MPQTSFFSEARDVAILADQEKNLFWDYQKIQFNKTPASPSLLTFKEVWSLFWLGNLKH